MSCLSTEAMIERLKAIRLLSLDVDGVMTDGGLYYTEDGTRIRRFSVRDGQGIKMIQAAGVEVCIISAGQPTGIAARARDLGIRFAFTGVPDKLAKLDVILAELGIGREAVAHIGDDVNDIVVMDAIGLGITVPFAAPETAACADYMTTAEPGVGAVREICDLILKSRGA